MVDAEKFDIGVRKAWEEVQKEEFNPVVRCPSCREHPMHMFLGTAIERSLGHNEYTLSVTVTCPCGDKSAQVHRCNDNPPQVLFIEFNQRWSRRHNNALAEMKHCAFWNNVDLRVIEHAMRALAFREPHLSGEEDGKLCNGWLVPIVVKQAQGSDTSPLTDRRSTRVFHDMWRVDMVCEKCRHIFVSVVVNDFHPFQLAKKLIDAYVEQLRKRTMYGFGQQVQQDNTRKLAV